MPVKRKPLQPKSNLFKPDDSPFFELFQQNRVPSPKERERLQGLIAEKKAHLSHLNSQVPKRRPGKKHKIPTELRAELTYARRFLEFHRAFFAPWRQLPVEIVSAIFLFTLKARNDISPDHPWVDDREGTLLLCQICSAWRAIAFITPPLWNTLSIRSCGRWARPDYEWISAWLAHSRSCPLYLQLLWDCAAVTETLNSVVSMFASHLHHTAQLAINGFWFTGPQSISHNDRAYPKLTCNPSVDSLIAPLLSTVVVLPPGSVWDWIHAACRASPCLTYLSTSHSALDSFPVANLTGLRWRYAAPMSQIFQIFEDASNLRDVDITVDEPIDDSVTLSSPTSRLNMKSVSKLGITAYDLLGEFLEQAEFPSVVSLRISDVHTWPNSTFHSSLSRWCCTLTTLEFYKCTISPEQIVAYLQHRACNVLELFSVQCAEGHNAADALLRYFTHDGTDQPLCNPSLRSILLWDIHAKDGLLSTMVESRARYATTLLSFGQPAPARLEEVDFSFWPAETQKTDHPEDWQRLRELKMMMRSLEIGWPDIHFVA